MASSKLKTTLMALIGPALAVATPVISGLISGKGARYQHVAQNAIRSAVTTTDNGLDHLITVFKSFEASNPLVQTAVSEFRTLATAAGITVPELDAVVSHLKCAIYDLATALVPADALKADATPVAAATTTQTAAG